MYTLTIYTLTRLMCMFCSSTTFYAADLTDVLKRNFLKWQLLREILLEVITLTSASYIVYWFSSEGFCISKTKRHAYNSPGVDV